MSGAPEGDGAAGRVDRAGADWIGVGITVALTAAVAVLSVVTGIANIGTSVPFGPVAAYVPEAVRDTAGFTGTLTGFLLIGSVLGLRRRLRVAWYSTAVLLPVAALQGVVQSSPLSVPLIVLSTLSVPVVLANRGSFDRSLSLTTTQLASAGALVAAQVYGTVGTYALREQFAGVDTLIDAFWYAIVTASTVGYGDATPTTQVGKVFGVSVLVLGVASFGIALTALLGPALESRVAKVLGEMTDSRLDTLEDHVLVLGYGELTEPILGELFDADVEFAVVTPDEARVRALVDRDVVALAANPSDDAPLHRARIGEARAILVATEDDAQDALAILTARELRPDGRIVAAATDRDNVEKLRRAGADVVIGPAEIGGHLLVESALGAEDTERLASRILEGRSDATPGEGGGDPAAE